MSCIQDMVGYDLGLREIILFLDIRIAKLYNVQVREQF
jgi:hypothetical protein